MKKTIKFAVVVAIACITQVVNAQKLSFPAAWEQYRSQMTFSRSQDLGNGNWRDIYLYQGKELYNDGYCPTCTANTQQPINIDNSNSVVTYDREIELMKAQYQAALLELEQLKLQNQQAYQAELLKMQKRQGRWAGFTSFLNGAGSVLTGSGTVMQGKAALDGKYGTNVYTNVYGTTTNQPQGGPWTGNTGGFRPVIQGWGPPQ